MAEFSVTVHFDGVGRVKVRADNYRDALEDAKQMDLADIEADLYNIKPIEAREIEREAEHG